MYAVEGFQCVCAEQKLKMTDRVSYHIPHFSESEKGFHC